MSRASLLLCALLAAGCADTYERGPAFDVSVPQRIAVLPFGDTSGGEGTISKPFTAAVDAIPLLSDEAVAKSPATILRNRFLANLRRTNLEVVSPSIVDTTLQLNALYDTAKLETTPPAQLARLLGADLLVYGTVTEWNRLYYAIEARVDVAMHVHMIHGASGKTVYDTRQSESHTSGLRGGPTGYGSALAAPLLGLSPDQYQALCNTLCRRIVDPLVVAETPEFKAADPPIISAATHTARTPLAAGEVLIVYAVGTAGGRARFRIGTTGASVPMTEFGPGRYRGSYVVQPGDEAREAAIEIELSRAGRTSAATLGGQPVSLAGR